MERGMNEGQEIINQQQEVTVDDHCVEINRGQESGMDGKKRQDVGRERWRDENGSLADDEEEEEEEENEDERRKSSLFSPLVEIVRKTAEKQAGCNDVPANDVPANDVPANDVPANDVPANDVPANDVPANDVPANDVCMRWENTTRSPRDHNRSCRVCCGEMASSVLFFLAGAVLFPVLVWVGYELLPIDLPSVISAPSRLLYTLRCALFATFPIILGVFVHGVSRLKFSSLNPLFEGKRANRHVVVHMTYVQDSLRLFLLFFVQLAVTSTYVHHDALKLVPLLTIVFVFGRLIYWPSLCFSSSVRALGFSLSFLPVLVLMGLNLYVICFSGEGVVFDVAPPTTPPPPKARWWG